MPNAILKLTKSKKGVNIIVPHPVTGVAHTYVTSVKYLKMMLNEELRGDLLGCKYLGDSPYDRFVKKDDNYVAPATINLRTQGEANPFDVKANKEREAKRISIRDDW